jgi:hypothetical protein
VIFFVLVLNTYANTYTYTNANASGSLDNLVSDINSFLRMYNYQSTCEDGINVINSVVSPTLHLTRAEAEIVYDDYTNEEYTKHPITLATTYLLETFYVDDDYTYGTSELAQVTNGIRNALSDSRNMGIFVYTNNLFDKYGPSLYFYYNTINIGRDDQYQNKVYTVYAYTNNSKRVNPF